MATVASIFDALKGPAEVGRIIGVTTEHAASMRRRGSIPVRYWPAILESVARFTPPPVTNEALIEAHAARRTPRISATMEARP